MKILYTNETGIVSIITPVTTEMTIEEMAQKYVPTGKKYKIVEDSDISTDRSFRNAWVVDEADLTDGVGA